mgnify:CR=1 FL=1
MLTPSRCIVLAQYRLLMQLRGRRKALDAELMKRNPLNYVEYFTYCKKLERMLLLLDNNNVIADNRFYDLKQEWKQMYLTNKETISNLFGELEEQESSSQVKDFKSASVSVLKRRLRDSRKSELLWRLKMELTKRVREGWFVVFNTLTVASDNVDVVFKRGSDEWRKYVQRIDNAVAKRLFGSVSAARRAAVPYHSYFGVVEEGSESGRLHIHSIHMVKVLPSGSVDPNLGSSKPYKRIIDRWRLFWPFGHSMPIAVRFSAYDAYGKLGWLWPCMSVADGRPIQAKPPQALASYTGKYISKNYTSMKRRPELWRVRMTRSLGMCSLKKLTMMTKVGNQRKLISQMWTGRQIRLKGKAVPLEMVKRTMVRSWIRRMWKKNRRSLWSYLQALKPQENIVKQLLRLITPKERYRTVSCMNLETRNWREMDIFSIRDQLDRIVTDLCGSFDSRVSSYGPVLAYTGRR